jgi:hypothetical protein
MSNPEWHAKLRRLDDEFQDGEITQKGFAAPFQVGASIVNRLAVMKSAATRSYPNIYPQIRPISFVAPSAPPKIPI